ncbi:DUF418 domain-containing protein [Erythrobacter sp. THAF29]|uniref:DUF418 domain-containing protein n=1 Tax=Erythrobacter sp. THAF29 TaxID=2587851 RepID=UPI001267F7DA|nr:DUF418 domain-containing protein [Erythrobacter sp. THAF29]QFT76940.1 hypothetical protein FIU90_05245 [Erythrobacter sp. THAF29]
MGNAAATGKVEDAIVQGDEALAPVTTSERISSLDFIRGIAVMGILAANIIAFGQPLMATLYPPAFLTDQQDPQNYWWLAQFVLIDGKMRGLFSLLFGAGLWLFIEKATARGSGQGLAVRRLAFLGMFGLIHFYFIWIGDILFLYAVSGLALLAFLSLKPVNQVILGVLGYVVSALIYTALLGGLYWLSTSGVMSDAETAEMQSEMMAGMEANTQMSAAIQSGDYGAFLAANFSENLLMPFSMLTQSMVETIGLMLIGMGLLRMGFFSGTFNRRKMILWGFVGTIGGALGMLWVGLWIRSTGFDVMASMFGFIALSAFPRLPMILGLAALLVIFSPAFTGWLGQRISAAGRAAFTNYLGTSILMLFVFHGWALGLYGELSRPQLYIVVLATWVVMLAWSKPWLDRFRYGPLEWLWRCLTYGKKFPIRR